MCERISPDLPNMKNVLVHFDDSASRRALDDCWEVDPQKETLLSAPESQENVVLSGGVAHAIHARFELDDASKGAANAEMGEIFGNVEEVLRLQVALRRQGQLHPTPVVVVVVVIRLLLAGGGGRHFGRQFRLVDDVGGEGLQSTPPVTPDASSGTPRRWRSRRHRLSVRDPSCSAVR